MKKILFLTPTLALGGSPLLIKNIIAGLDKNKFEVHVWSPVDGELKNEYEKIGISVYVQDFYVDKINREQNIEINDKSRNRINKLIDKCRKANKKLAIRCAGTYAKQLIEEFDFQDVLIGLFDNNPALIGKDINGYKIYPVDMLDNFDISIIIIAHNQPKFIKKELDNKKFKIIDDIFTGSGFELFLKSIKYKKKLNEPLKFFKEINPDIIVANNAVTFWAPIVGKKMRKKVIWTIHEGLSPKTYRVFPQNLFFKSFKYPDRFAFPSRATYEFYKDFIPEEKIKVIHCGIALNKIGKFISEDKPELTRQELNIPSDNKVVSIVGVLSQMKGQIHFAKAAINLLKRSNHRKFTFLIVGSNENEYSRQVQQLINESGFKEHFRIIAVTPDVFKYFSISDICVNSSFTESFGIANIEAMAFRKPVMATNVCGSAEIIIHNETGILYPLDNIEFHIEKNILYLTEHTDIANQLVDNAYNKLIENFTFDKTLEGYSNLLNMS